MFTRLQYLHIYYSVQLVAYLSNSSFEFQGSLTCMRPAAGDVYAYMHTKISTAALPSNIQISSARYSLISTMTAPGSARSKQCMSLRRSCFTTQRGIIATSTRAHFRVEGHLCAVRTRRGSVTASLQKSQLNNQQRYPPHHDRTGLHLVHLPSYLSVCTA